MYYTRIVSCSILHIIRVWCAQLHVRFHLNRCGLFREITERSREREERKKPYQNPYNVAVKRSEEKKKKWDTDRLVITSVGRAELKSTNLSVNKSPVLCAVPCWLWKIRLKSLKLSTNHNKHYFDFLIRVFSFSHFSIRYNTARVCMPVDCACVSRRSWHTVNKCPNYTKICFGSKCSFSVFKFVVTCNLRSTV